MAAVTYPTLEHVAMEARPYPTHLLEGCDTGLVLFAAAFLGHNDAIHFAEAGIDTTCVDIDGERLAEMGAVYPREWEFVSEDAWRFARLNHGPWDAVSVDTFTGDAMRRSLDSLELWCSLARKVVTVTITDGVEWKDRVPSGWWGRLFQRSGNSERGVYWLALTR